MTISSTVNKSGPYFGNGVATDFIGEFPIFADAHTKIILADGDGAESILDLGSDYTVSGVGGDQFTVHFAVAPASDESVVILLSVPFTQETDLENQGPFYAETVERAFDLAAQRDLQLAEEISRAVRIPATGDISDLDALIHNVLAIGAVESSLPSIAGIAAEIEIVAAISSGVAAVAAVAPAVVAVATVSVHVAVVADYVTEIENVSANIAAVLAAGGHAEDAEDAAALAEKWASEAEDVPVEVGRYSALHWAAKAADYAAATAPMPEQIDAAADEAFADTAMLPARKADGSLIKRSWANVKTLLASTFLKLGGNQTVTGGFNLTSYSAGTKSSGTFTPDPANQNYQYYTNGGAHTVAAPASDCAIDILVTNNGSAGSITFSGFTVASGNTGDPLTTTNGHKFLISIRRMNSVSTYIIKALQ